MPPPLSLIPPVVAATIEGSYGHHRTAWFEDILARTATSLSPALGARTPLMLTTTLLGAREAVVANTVWPGRTAWVSPGGAFSGLVATWQGQAAVLDARGIEELANHAGRAPLVLLDHVDAGGALLDLATSVDAITSAAPDALIVVDATVSFGADTSSFAGLAADAVLIAPEGALMGIPGLAIVGASERLLDHVRSCRDRLDEQPYYCDLLRYEKQWRNRTTPYSPNISATIALCKALELIEAGGGLERHVRRHAERATSFREALRTAGIQSLVPSGPASNAFTVAERPLETDTVVIGDADVSDAHVEILEGGARIRIDHTGYLPEGALTRVVQRLREAPLSSRLSVSRPAIADIVLPQVVPANIPPDASAAVFEIAPGEFAAQAALHARRAGGGGPLERRITEAARAVFRDQHRYSPHTLASRTVGFIGAGNITRHAVEKCRALGVRRLMVYSPSLAERPRGASADDPKGIEYWSCRSVVVAGSPDDVFRDAHTIVLLPWFYDREALDAFGKPDVYLNDGLVSAAVLSMIEREGCADLLINAAAREALVDRRALAAAVAAGWLRYLSDELPSSDDPLLDLPQARFTGHVGGSCARPQAAVARNTHRILRQLATVLATGGEFRPDADPEYSLNVLNRAVERRVPWRITHRSDRREPIRVFITDPFDVDSLDFDRLRSDGYAIEVLDVSGERPAGPAIEAHLGSFRPHIWLLRSRTIVDRDLAGAAVDVPELAAIVRPGVGIDNLYGGLRELTRAGILVVNEPHGNSSAVAEMTVHFILSASGQTLLAPGPTPYRPEVFEVMAEYGHPARAAFGRAHREVCDRLGTWFSTRSDVVIVSGSGTALMEGGIASLTQRGDRGLVISHGKFGDRFIDIAHARSRLVEALRVDEPEWGRAVTPAEVRTRLDDVARAGGRIRFLCLQQNETSSGVTYHAQQLAEIVRAARAHDPGLMIIVDAISGAFAHPLAFDTLDVDLLVTGSQKGLGVSSGLAYAIVSSRALDKMLRMAGFGGNAEDWVRDAGAWDVVDAFERRQKVRYLGLLRTVLEHRLAVFDDSPSVFHVLSSLRALQLHDQDGGPDAVLARHAAMAQLVRDGLASAGLRPVSHPPYASNSVTPAFVSGGMSAPELRKQLQAFYGLAIAGAQGDYWKAQMIRIGHLGFVYPDDLVRCLRALRIVQSRAEATGKPPLDAPPAVVA